MWATLSCDLLLEIFRRLGSTEVIRSAGVCRPWRRAVIDNASCLHPRLDRFRPDLLLAFLDPVYLCGRLKYEPAAGTSENVPALDGVDVSVYDTLLASRDGFLLLLWRNKASSSLCLCNPLTGSRRFLPAAEFATPAFASYRCTYVLATGYDDDDDSMPDGDGAGGSLAVRILAMVQEDNGITYQIFSSTSGGGAWGPVKRSAKIVQENLGPSHVLTEPNRHVVVCRGSVVYWLVLVLVFAGNLSPRTRTCLFAMDMRTERTWTTELPEAVGESPRVVATSEDGRRLSLIVSRKALRKVEVWVLDGDSRWTLQRTMDMKRLLLTNCPMTSKFFWVCVCGFCPRSGCLFGIAMDMDEITSTSSSSASMGARPG